jgi:aryl-alcohol dehydrogenase
MAAKLVGCTTIIAIDLRKERLAVAREIGATHIIDSNQATANFKIGHEGSKQASTPNSAKSRWRSS